MVVISESDNTKWRSQVMLGIDDAWDQNFDTFGSPNQFGLYQQTTIEVGS
jgi:hypothetical protein